MSLITLGLGETTVMAPISVNVIENIEIDQDDLIDLEIDLDGTTNLELELREC